MFRCVILCLFFGGITLAFSQDTRILNTSEDGRFNSRRPEDYQSPEHNLWLITRDDPIPASLSGRWSVGEAIPVGQIINLRTNGYNNQFPSDAIENRPTQPFQSPVAVVPDTPVIAYDRTLTAVNRRQSPDEFVRDPDAFLLQLPVEVTEGLWERPPQPRNLQLPVNGRQSGDVQNVDIKFEQVTRVERPGETPPAVFVPVRELTSRLPGTDFLPHGEANVPSGQYYELPIQAFTLPSEGNNANGINVSSDFTNLNESRNILLYRQDRAQTTGLEGASENVFYEHYGHDSSQTDRNVHEVGSILTSEDIELLEKLGILSSLILEPVVSANVSDNTTSALNSQREYETKLPLIDNGGQNYSINTGREDSANFSEVVLFDVPQFAVAEYHSNIPENSGLNGDAIRITPLTALEFENPQDLSLRTNGSLGHQNNVNISDRQLLEILQLLNLEVGDFFNISRPSDIKHETITEGRQRAENHFKNNQQVQITGQTVLGQVTATNSTLQSTATKQRLNDSSSRTEAWNENETVSVPSVKNGRIQPRLLEKLTPKENEIMERLFQNTLPISESKLEMLKKLKIQPQPYFFGFRQDDGNGTLQHRNETSDSNGVVKGSYGYRDAMGVYRNVSYIADTNGFHAVVKTNEPGMVSHNTADAVFMSETPPLAALLKMIAYKRPKISTTLTRQA